MIFSSLVFLCIFLPLVLILHMAVPNRKFRNGLLLVASLLFYTYGEPIYVLLMVTSAVLNYGFARLMGNRKWVLALAVAVNIGLLGVFKYAGFLVSAVNGLAGLSLPVPRIELPIGISFFTFQALSYVIDVYRQQVPVQRNFGKLLLYISLFPQLIAGPIVRYADIAEQIDRRTVSWESMALGLRRFILGLGKKVLIANTMAAVADRVFGAGDWNVLSAWIGAVAYLFQIYYDFSGYSDMAIGLGWMFGFQFKENFDHPYISRSIQEFWRRWHISLSTWFRDYVYIPLGGNRKGRLRTVTNKLTVFFLTGLWHGANWTFVVWGLFHGCFLLLEEYVPKLRQLPKVLGNIYTLLTVTLGFVIFRADSLGQAWRYIGTMFTGFDFSAGAMSLALQQLTPFFLCVLLAAVLCARPIGCWAGKLQAERPKLAEGLSFVFAFFLLGWCMLRLAGGSYNPFIYFRF